MRALFIYTVLLFWSVGIYGQQITFQMSALGINFGKMTVTKTKENDSTDLYTLHAKGVLKVLWIERSDETKNSVRYQNGYLIASSYTQLESGKKTAWNTIRFDGKKYNVESEKGKRSFTEKPTFSVLKLYFQHPENLTRIFSEAEADFVSVNHIDNSIIELKDAAGRRNLYFYNGKGTVDKLEFYTAVAKVSMKRI